ncbi:hypothetical protein WJX73_009226 [Symbiochloris irregularis]|uniref:DNA mismatch repair protein S5 domain-containing protein n=1 Tax=Symbiochloris irregularis TaxID=706552 RepID=A0AAW1NRK9_9CHLO
MNSTKPAAIRQLDEAVVNQIAAGEIIQRPVNALKEMLENSLDAGATSISVTVKDGGNKLLQIQDNGHGVDREDLPLLCQRHATSKLREYEDLTSINTLGFRGEALASISYIAHLTVTTMTHGATHGLKVAYRDGVMDPAGPKPCAANPGTTILVEDLFYNSSTRKKALKASSDEYGRILDMLGCYAVFKAGVAFSCKKQGESKPDLHTMAGSSRLDNIRTVHGAAVARALLPFKATQGATGTAVLEEDAASFTAEGYASGPDYNGKKTQLILFINGRPVDCSPLKRAIEATYAAVLPKGYKPFVFLELQLPGDHVDVNLHPTKHEVGFLHQDALIEQLCAALDSLLTAYDTQRTYKQTLLPGAAALPTGRGTESPTGTQTRSKDVADNKMVRTDSRDQTLHAFMPRPSSQQLAESPRDSGTLREAPSAEAQPVQERAGSGSTRPPLAERIPSRKRRSSGLGDLRQEWEAEEQGREEGVAATTGARAVRQRPNPANACDLTSIQELTASISDQAHEGLADIVRHHIFVGLADHTLTLVQHGTRLYLLNAQHLTRDMFYQQVLRRFEQAGSIAIQGAATIAELAELALEDEGFQNSTAEDPQDSIASVAQLTQQLLLSKAEMLRECVGINIDSEGRLVGLPALIDHYTPDLDRLPQFVLRLARHVDWQTEKECFQGLAEALAQLYMVQPPILMTPADADAVQYDRTQPPKAKTVTHADSLPAESQEAPGPIGDVDMAAGTSDQQATLRAVEDPSAELDNDDIVRQALGPGPSIAEAGPIAAAGGDRTADAAADRAAEDSQGADGSAEATEERAAAQERWKQHQWTMQHVLFPALRLFLKPGRHRAADGSVVELTRLEKLYRIFERC